jgi:MFS family permease
MQHTIRFKSKAMPVLVLGIFMMYFYSGLQTDHLNVLTPYYTKLGWDTVTITNPVTWAGFAVIPATLLVGTLLLKKGIPQVVVPSTIIVALAMIGLAFAGTHILQYDICLFCMRLFILPLQMGAFMLCTNWFIENRGKALGIVTIGSPLCTASFIYLLSRGVTRRGFTASYATVSIILLVLALLIKLLIHTAPEELGMHPDGKAVPSSFQDKDTDIHLTFREVFSKKESWLLVISYGFLQFCIVGIMSFYVFRLQKVGTVPSLYFFWLSAAAILGIPFSCLFGCIDDRFSTIKASYFLCLTFIMSLLGLRYMKANCSWMLALTAIGIAGVTGGTPTLHPSITSYVFGRKQYQAANRWIMTVQAILMAFSLYFMSSILDLTGSLDLAYDIMVILIVIAIICLAVIGKKPDYDRQRN